MWYKTAQKLQNPSKEEIEAALRKHHPDMLTFGKMPASVEGRWLYNNGERSGYFDESHHNSAKRVMQTFPQYANDHLEDAHELMGSLSGVIRWRRAGKNFTVDIYSTPTPQQIATIQEYARMIQGQGGWCIFEIVVDGDTVRRSDDVSLLSRLNWPKFFK